MDRLPVIMRPTCYKKLTQILYLYLKQHSFRKKICEIQGGQLTVVQQKLGNLISMLTFWYASIFSLFDKWCNSSSCRAKKSMLELSSTLLNRIIFCNQLKQFSMFDWYPACLITKQPLPCYVSMQYVDVSKCEKQVQRQKHAAPSVLASGNFSIRFCRQYDTCNYSSQ